MNITITQAQGRVPTAVFKLDGELDASNYRQLISKAKEAYAGGMRNILLDLSDLSYMSSAGLLALHSIALVLRGETPPDPEGGWGALRGMERERAAGVQPHVKLLAPQPRVDRVLRMAGFDRLFEVHTDRETALASF